MIFNMISGGGSSGSDDFVYLILSAFTRERGTSGTTTFSERIPYIKIPINTREAYGDEDTVCGGPRIKSTSDITTQQALLNLKNPNDSYFGVQFNSIKEYPNLMDGYDSAESSGSRYYVWRDNVMMDAGTYPSRVGTNNYYSIWNFATNISTSDLTYNWYSQDYWYFYQSVNTTTKAFDTNYDGSIKMTGIFCNGNQFKDNVWFTFNNAGKITGNNLSGVSTSIKLSNNLYDYLIIKSIEYL